MGTPSPPFWVVGDGTGVVGDEFRQWARGRLRSGSWVAYFRQPAGRSGPQANQCGGGVLLESEVSKGCRSLCVFSDIQLFTFSSRDVKNKRALGCDVKS